MRSKADRRASPRKFRDRKVHRRSAATNDTLKKKYSFLHSLAGCRVYRRVPVEAGGRDRDPCGTPQQ